MNVQDHFYVGHGAMSSEATSNTTYICRASTVSLSSSTIIILSLHSIQDTPHPPSKSLCVGEVGWGVPGNADYSLLKTGNQIIVCIQRTSLLPPFAAIIAVHYYNFHSSFYNICQFSPKSPPLFIPL